MPENVEKKKNRQPKEPVAARNTFFWFAGILLIVAIIGLVRGDEVIRDPGQVRENGIAFIYLGAAIVMAVNGWITHRHAWLTYLQEQEEYAETIEGSETLPVDPAV